MPMETELMSYAGIKKCGCCVAAAVDNPEHKAETAKEVAKWIREGLTIERKTKQWVKENFTICECDDKQKNLL